MKKQSARQWQYVIHIIIKKNERKQKETQETVKNENKLFKQI